MQTIPRLQIGGFNRFLHILPFVKQDYQMYPQYSQWRSFTV